MKKLLTVFLLVSVAVLSGCGSSGKPADLPPLQEYPPWEWSDVSTVYVFDVTNIHEPDEYLFAQAIQGITAREKPQVYLNHLGRLGYNVWIEETQKKHGFEIVAVSDIWGLYDIFKDYIDGYILYPAWGTETMNHAATLAGVFDAVPVTPRLRAEAARRGMQQLENAANYRNISQIINKYGSRLNRTRFLNQDFNNITLRDYGIKHRTITVNQNPQSGLDAVYAFLEPNAVMFGWGPGGEIQTVHDLSLQSIIAIPTDHALNMSFYEEEFSTDTFTQHELIDKDLRAQPGKHYVSFSYSDGDNVQWLINELPQDPVRWAHPDRNVPLGWPLAPELPRYAPIILEYMYRTAKPTDNVISAGCGYGYIFPSLYNMDHLIAFGELTAEVMRRSDMHYLEILDEFFDGETKPEVFEAYLRNPQIKGILYRTGHFYAGGKGFVKWVNGKPIVSYRDALWNMATYNESNERQRNRDVYRLAYRLSQFDKDPTTIDGYTMVMVHAWSHHYESIQKVADWLAENDPDVVIVTPSTIMRLIEENVPKADAAPARTFFDRDWDYSSVAHLY